MRYNIITLLVAFIMHFNLLFAQDNSKEARKILSEAEEHFEAEETELALESFMQANKLVPNDMHTNYMIGVCYHTLGHGAQALPYLEASQKCGNKSLGIYYYIGISLHLCHKFDESITALQKFLANSKGADDHMIEKAKITLKYCTSGKELVKNPVKVTIKNLGPNVNSKFPDYVPGISADETVLAFTSRRDNTTGGKRDPNDGLYFEDVYISVKKDNEWTKAEKIGFGINTEGHDGCVGLSPDGQELFIYRNIKQDNNGGDLFYSNLKGDQWTLPKNMGKGVNTKYWEPHGSITADENSFFFASNREGGYGGTDIYMVRKSVSGTWGTPILLGPKVNTPLDEDGPFIHADGKTLYFSSEGHNSMGGYDIFTCIVNTETGEIIDEPKNIGYPINTADHDIYFVWSADGKRAYFSSYREGGYGEKDLYVLERDVADAALVVLKGTIKSCENDKPLAATIVITDNTTGKPLGVYNSNSSTGKYTVILPAGKNYGIAVEAPGYLFYSKNIDIPLLNHYLEVNDSICLEKIEIGKHIVLRNVFFDYDKATLRNESQSELERLADILKDNPTIKIQIDGHTDSDGNDDYNLKLSDARAHSVVDYLVNKKGINRDRLSWKGYGETVPVVPNDTPENKQLNRRTEFEIISN